MSKWNLPVPQRFYSGPQEFVVSLHAMKQFYKRYLKTHPNLTQQEKDSVEFFYETFRKHFLKSKQMKRKNSVTQLIYHKFQPAKYFVSNEWVFVVEEATNTILTCYTRDVSKNIFIPCK